MIPITVTSTALGNSDFILRFRSYTPVFVFSRTVAMIIAIVEAGGDPLALTRGEFDAE